MVKYLVIHLDNLGDYLMSTPLIRGLKQQVEEAEIHYLCGELLTAMVQSNPYLSKIHTLNANLNVTIDDLLVEDFDYIIDLQLDVNTHRLKQKLPIPSFEYEALNFKQWLYVNFKINQLPDTHLVDRFIDTAQVFDVKNDGKGLDFFIPENEEVKAQSMHAAFEGKFMVVVLDAAYETRMIPLDKLSAIINMSGVPVCLLGADINIDKASYLEKKLKVPYLNAIGKIGLNQAASLINQSALVLSPDSDYMHLATAFSKPIISIWGNTVPAFGKSPYLVHEQSALFQVNDLRCRPCTKKGFDTCPKKHFKCMNDINSEEIIKKITALIN